MSSFEPTVVIYGSPVVIASANLTLPVSSLFAFDVTSLEKIVNVSPSLSQSCLNRYFVILLEPIDKDFLTSLHSNHRIISIYDKETMCDNSQDQLNRMTNSFRQLTLDLSNDIVQFLISEGEKQIKLERLNLTKIYYQQARILKEWIMAFFKAEPNHILLISLNSTQQNLDSAQQRLQKICTKLGYSSTIIRQLNNYIPSNERHSALLPYSKLLFNNEDPSHMCQLIKKLSPIRFYLYGNELCNLNDWSKLMIETEKDLMDDEDNWCAFIENEFVDNEVKWNFGFIFGRQWQLSRVSPLDLNQLDDNPRFQSALRRAHITFAERQIEVTTDIFDWYGKCIERGYLYIEPKLSHQQASVKLNQHQEKPTLEISRRYPFRNLSSFDYPRLDCSKIKSISFIWLDQILHDSQDDLDQIIQPFQWNFFDQISNCMSFIERQLREQRYIFLIVSGSIGNELFLSGLCLIKQIFATYIYCAQLGSHLNWSQKYSQIRGVYNDSFKLAQQIKRDYNQLQNSLHITETNWDISSNTTQQNKISEKTEDVESFLPLPLTVYNPEESHLFLSHQRTIDTLLCMPHTSESKSEMLDEFRRIYNGNELILCEIDNFESTYHSNAAVQWYTKDSFICRTINQALRSSDIDTMFKLRYILIDIYDHLNQSYKQRQSLFYQSPSEIYYRGQIMSNKQFDRFKELQGNIISINTFLSTTTSMQIALMYAGKYHGNSDMISVVFSIEKDSLTSTRPYANISRYSLFPDEDEVLFSMGSVFRIGNIREMPNADNIWIIHLKMTGQQDYRFTETSS